MTNESNQYFIHIVQEERIIFDFTVQFFHASTKKYFNLNSLNENIIESVLEFYGNCSSFESEVFTNIIMKQNIILKLGNLIDNFN